MKVLSIVSARPNFIKLAGFHHAFKEHTSEGWEHQILHTGQHYDPLFSDVFFNELSLPDPVKNLEVQGGATNEDTVARTKEACIPLLGEIKPDLVMVYGDVSGALGGAEAANTLKIPVAHVEAGLRSFDQDMPEERNRKAIDHIAQILFVTEQSGVKNLENENITEGVHFVGNTMIDTLARMQGQIHSDKYSVPHPERFGIVTLHRPSNVDFQEVLERAIEFINQVSEQCPLIFPMHRRTASAFEKFSLQSQLCSSIDVREPLGYLEFLHLVSTSNFVLTDSGGIQEEATYLGIPCFTLRKNTERPCTLIENGGTNVLIDSDQKKKIVFHAAQNVFSEIYQNMKPEYWDGKAGERIVKILRDFFR